MFRQYSILTANDLELPLGKFGFDLRKRIGSKKPKED
jgi:hypothetical protein